jgi:hypothetical protein
METSQATERTITDGTESDSARERVDPALERRGAIGD